MFKKDLGLLVLILVVGAAVALINPRFLSPINLSNTANLIGLFGLFSIAEAFVIITGGIELSVGSLSGGNQQKVVLARWLSMKPRVIIFDEPTRGIDVGAKNEIYELMRALADQGVAILMISSDMEEVIGVSDRIAVMHEGAISGFLERAEFSEHNVLQLAVGNRLH
jgi:ribose transport system ATP-binding protein